MGHVQSQLLGILAIKSVVPIRAKAKDTYLRAWLSKGTSESKTGSGRPYEMQLLGLQKQTKNVCGKRFVSQ